MRKVTYPTRVALSEIPEEGRRFFFDDDSAELTPRFADILSDRPYKIELFLKPVGNVYEITGQIDAKLEIPCSRCGTEVITPCYLNFTELIMVEKARPRKSSTTHISHTEEGEGPFCNYVYSDMFDLGDFAHEQIVANAPFQVYCGQANCDDYVKLLQKNDEEPLEPPESRSPFAILKQLKPN